MRQFARPQAFRRTSERAPLPRRLQLGAFDQACEGWLNTDITPHLLLARVPGLAWVAHRLGVLDERRYAQHRAGVFRALRWLDVSRPFRFADGTFQAIYCAHLLEHLYPAAAARCVRECHRVLMPGGVLRIAVPDLDALVASYDPLEPDRFLYGLLQARGARGERPSARHRWHYNERSLRALLESCGFAEPVRRAFREGLAPDLERIETREWSLFMEAVK
jgi:SAM-dependent methyltransferase